MQFLIGQFKHVNSLWLFSKHTLQELKGCFNQTVVTLVAVLNQIGITIIEG